MIIQNKFEIGETVIIKSDPDKHIRTVLIIQINPNGLLYKISLGEIETWHYATELEKQQVLDK